MGDRPKVIAFEGADRVGKATQARLLQKSLRKRSQRVYTQEIPYADGVTHPQIYEMLAEGTASRFPVVFQTLHAINRRLFEQEWLSDDNSLHFFILDRWTLSTRVYGEATGVSKERTDHILKGLMEPDLTFILDGDPFKKADLDTWEKNADLQLKVRDLYRRHAQDASKDYILIDANQDIETVHDEIKNLVFQWFKL